MDKVVLNGVEVYPFTSESQLLDFVDEHKGILVAINAEKILHATEQTRGIINRNIGYCDGAGAQLAVKQKGYKDAAKLPGCELWLKIVAKFHDEKTFYLVGSKPQVIEETVAKLRQEYPGINIVGYRDGYLKSDDEKERDTISVIPRIFASVAWMLIGYYGLPLVEKLGKGDQALGFVWLGGIIAAVFLICSIVTFTFVRDRAPIHREANRNRTSVREMVRILVKNDQVIVVLILSLLFNISFQLSNGFAVYYFKYAIGIQDLLSSYLLAAGIAQLCGLSGYPFFASYFGRKIVFAASALFPVLGFAVLLLGKFPVNETMRWWAVFLTGGCVNFGIGLSLGILTVMLADVVDYGEYKLGTRNESILFSTQTFVVKLAGALSGFLTGTGLSLIGFVADAVQGPAAVTGIRVIMGGIPMLFSLLYLVLYWKCYRLDGEFLQRVKESCREKTLPHPQPENR